MTYPNTLATDFIRRTGLSDIYMLTPGGTITVSVDKRSAVYEGGVVYTTDVDPTKRSAWSILTSGDTADVVDFAVPASATGVAFTCTAITDTAVPRLGALFTVKDANVANSRTRHMRQSYASGDAEVVPLHISPPPFFANLQGWHDFSDLSTLTKVGGGPPTADDDRLTDCVNKGFDAPALTLHDADNDNPYYRLTDGPNGTGFMYATNVNPGNSADLRDTNAATTSGTNGMSVFQVQAKIGEVSVLGDHEWRWNDNVSFTPAISHFVTPDRWEFNGFSETVDLGGGVVLDEFHAAFFSIDGPSGILYTGRSGQPIVTTTSTVYNDVASGEHYNLVVEESAISMNLLYDRSLNLGEIAEVLAWLDSFFGTLPVIVATPA